MRLGKILERLVLLSFLMLIIYFQHILPIKGSIVSAAIRHNIILSTDTIYSMIESGHEVNKVSVANEGKESKASSKEKLDINYLKDGKYSVYIDLWNANANKASMGNAAINRKALLTVRNGIYHMDLSTHPITLGTITSCLQSLQIKQIDGTYVFADITARNNLNNQPSVFHFTLPSIEEYIDVKIDPKVEVMGTEPLPARIKISLDTIIQEDESAQVEENNEKVVSGIASEAINITDNNTKVKVLAKENIVQNGIILTVRKYTSGKAYDSVKKLLNLKNESLVLYNLNLSLDNSEVQPEGMVEIRLPISSSMNKKSLLVYRMEDNTKTKITGTIESDYYVFQTNKIGVFAFVGNKLQKSTLNNKDETKDLVKNSVKESKKQSKSQPKSNNLVSDGNAQIKSSINNQSNDNSSNEDKVTSSQRNKSPNIVNDKSNQNIDSMTSNQIKNEDNNGSNDDINLDNRISVDNSNRKDDTNLVNTSNKSNFITYILLGLSGLISFLFTIIIMFMIVVSNKRV